MRKILVFRGGALGDFLVTLPALAALRQRWPGARIELVGNAAAAQLAVARGLLDAAHSQHDARWAALHGDPSLPPAFAAWLAGFDLVINYWPDPDGELRRRFPMSASQTFLSAAAMPARAPAAAHYCAPLRALGIERREMWFRLNPAGPALVAVPSRGAHDNCNGTPASGGPTLSNPIVIHPGSGSPRKNWPLENWRTLAEQLPAPVSVILGEAEPADSSRAFFPPDTRFLINRSLEDLVAHLSRARLFLGHDSGISHLAAACGAPCVLLFGPTDPALWAPPAPNVRVLQRSPQVSSIAVSEVVDAARGALSDPR